MTSDILRLLFTIIIDQIVVSKHIMNGEIRFMLLCALHS
jgi:hypothetical protein